MAREEMYLIRDEQGHMRTILAHSLRGAARTFVIKYLVPQGYRFYVKKRGEGDWVEFSRTSTGVRQLGE